MRTSLVEVGRFGRLGNQLWSFANVVAYAFENGLNVCHTSFDGCSGFEFARRSNATSSGCVRVLQSNATFARMLHFAYRINLRLQLVPHIAAGENLCVLLEAKDAGGDPLARFPLAFVSGLYLHAPRAMERFKSELKESFRPLHEHIASARLGLDPVRARADLVVGIHVRHGDYKTFCDGVMYYTTSEYASVARCIAQQLAPRRVSFIICSDEPQDLSKFDGLDAVQFENTAIADLALLSMCDYIFGPNSSYSQWASFIGDVPLHVLDWKNTQIHKKGETPLKEPSIAQHFSVFAAEDFPRYSAGSKSLSAFASLRA